jgi:hypothetical protein
MYQNTEGACHSAPKEPKSSLAGTGAELCPHLRYYKSVALSYHNGTITSCLSLSAPVSLERSIADKIAVSSPRVLPCRPLSLSGSGYESEGRRFESCRARYEPESGLPEQFQTLASPQVSLQNAKTGWK